MRFVLLSKLNLEDFNSKIILEIIKISKSINPKILYIPTASLDNPSNIQKTTDYFVKYNLDVTTLLLYDKPFDEDLFYQKILKNDIIFFGGGNTKVLVDYMKKYHLKENIKKLETKVVCGLSAGTNMLAKYGMGDSDSYINNYHLYNFKLVEGLGVLDYVVCPHYQQEDLVVFNDIIKKYKINSLAIEDYTAIFIDKDRLYALKDNKQRQVFYYLKDDYIMKEFLESKNYKV